MSGRGDCTSCGRPAHSRGLCHMHYRRYRLSDEWVAVAPRRAIPAREDPRYQRSATLQHRYSITLEQYEALLESQGGACKICRAEESQTGKSFSVDHDHNCCPGRRSCGKCIRGLICYSCNTHLGWYDRNAESVRRYLEAS